MAHIDLKTGKIFGCKPGSLTWLHEQGHAYYNKQAWGVRLFESRCSFQDLTILLCAMALNFKFFFWRWLALACAAGWLGLYVFEELWCWAYALRKKKFI